MAPEPKRSSAQDETEIWMGEQEAAARDLLSKQWDLGIDWGRYRLVVSESAVRFALREGIWHVAILRRVVEDEAKSRGQDVNRMFVDCRKAAKEVVRELVTTNSLNADGCATVAFLLLIVTCRDLDLPDGGRHHAMNLLRALDYRDNGDPEAPTDADLLQGVWKAVWALDYAGLVDLGGWRPHEIVFEGTRFVGIEPVWARALPPAMLPN